jgi:SAM-dependent methyltransferase
MILQDSRSRAFQLLGDPVRWRLLRLLQREPLRVGEATAIVGVAQSGTSRHLGLLREAGLVSEERRGGGAWYALAAQPPPGLTGLWSALLEELEASPDRHGDDARLAEALRLRAEQGDEVSATQGTEPGRSWAAWAQTLARLLPPRRVLHLGADGGALSVEIARFASELVAVDDAPASAAQARARLAGLAQARVVEAPLHAVPCPDASFDLVVVAQSLARLDEPATALREAARLLRTGGTVLVLDLLPHEQAWVRERLGHRRLGLAPETLAAWLAAAGFVDVQVEALERRRGNPFVVLCARATRSAAALPPAPPDPGARP